MIMGFKVCVILTLHKPSSTGAKLDAVEDVGHLVVRNPLMLHGLEANSLEAVDRIGFVGLHYVSIVLLQGLGKTTKTYIHRSDSSSNNSAHVDFFSGGQEKDKGKLS